MDVSVIIVNWNTRDILRDCLSSVFKETQGLEFEVIVIDNGSDDGSVEMVEADFPEAIVIANAENRGFAAANNQGIAIAKGSFILLLNSDTMILDDAIGKTVVFARTHPDAAVVGCRVLNPDHTMQRTCFMYPSVLNTFLGATYLYKIFPKSKFFGREHMMWWGRDDVQAVDVVTGCFMLVRRRAIEQVGLMDERYFVYGEETDWCYRFKKAGWKIMFSPDGRIIHYAGQSTSHKARAFRLQLEGSKLIFMKLYGSRAAFPFACLLVGLFFFVRVPYWFTLGLFKKKEGKKPIEQAVTYLIGTWHSWTNWKRLLMNKDAIEGML